jgi:predicted RNA-binding protein with EMAP domain
MKIGITPQDAKYHYVNILEIESHEKAMEIKKTLENILEEKSD